MAFEVYKSVGISFLQRFVPKSSYYLVRISHTKRVN